MIRRSLREWDYLAVAESGGDDVIPRLAADSLVAAARTAGIGGADGEAILVNGYHRLRAQQVVGVLVSPIATLEILPKIDGLNAGAVRHRLIHMLARVFDLDVVIGPITDLGWQQDDLLEILIRLFCDRLFDAVHRGLPRRYVGQEADLSALRERLDVQRQFTILAVSPQKLACRYEDLSPDIPLNQIMRAAVNFLLRIARASGNQRRLAELSFAFADVSVVPINQLPWDRVILDRTNIAWATLLKFARLLLGQRFQTTSTGGEQGFSLLFEMNTLFEEYIGRTLRRALGGSGLDVYLQAPRDHALAEDNGTRRFPTRPDIVISLNAEHLLIVDTKWKRLNGPIDDPQRGVGQADVYQMMAYSQVYQCGRLMLLYPHYNEIGSEEGILDAYSIRGTPDSRLIVASASLSDLAGLGDRLRRLVFNTIDIIPTQRLAA
jgi:5-methylcytosine-specific restriction enzyme subunit McrC